MKPESLSLVSSFLFRFFEQAQARRKLRWVVSMWGLMALLTTFFWGVYGELSGPPTMKHGARVTMFCMASGYVIMSLAWAIWTEWGKDSGSWEIHRATWKSVLMGVLAGIILAAGSIGFFKAVEIAPSGIPQLLVATTGIPYMGMLCKWVVAGKPPSFREVVGAAIAMLAIYIATSGTTAPESSP